MTGKEILVTEVGTRDGFQSEPGFVPTVDKIEIIDAVAEAGFRRIEATSFVSPRAVPQLADAEAVMAGVNRKPGVVYACLAMNAKGVERAARARVDEVVAVVSTSESHSRTNFNKSMADAIAEAVIVSKEADSHGLAKSVGVSMAFGCSMEGNIPSGRVVDIVSRLADQGFRQIMLGDSTGMGTPPIVREVCEAVLRQVPGIEISLHIHDTRGLGLVNVLTGLELGITRYDSSFGGLGGCPFIPGATGNICTEDLVYMLHELGYETGVDLEKVRSISQRVEKLVGHPLPGHVTRAGARLSLRDASSAKTAVG